MDLHSSKMQCIPTNEYAGSVFLRGCSNSFEVTPMLLTVRLSVWLWLSRTSCKDMYQIILRNQNFIIWMQYVYLDTSPATRCPAICLNRELTWRWYPTSTVAPMSKLAWYRYYTKFMTMDVCVSASDPSTLNDGGQQFHLDGKKVMVHCIIIWIWRKNRRKNYKVKKFRYLVPGVLVRLGICEFVQLSGLLMKLR